MLSDPTPAAGWSRKLAPYKQSSASRSLLEIAVTLGALLFVWVAALLAARTFGWWAALPLTVPAAGLLVRMFMIQHDCGHGAFFRSRAANDWTGRLVSVLTITPYEYWRRTHDIHHATSGDLDRRGAGAVETLTVGEYRALSPLRRLGYRLYRHPLVLFGVGPAFVFFLQHRVPVDLMRHGWRPWLSTLGSTAATVGLLAAASLAFGAVPVLVVFGTTALLAATIGVWLFYVQHQFEGAEWVRSEGWKPASSALASSSHYALPQPLRWFTANIGVHHVHHLSSRIPFYRLQQIMADHPELAQVNRISLRDSFRYAGLALWDEEARRLVSFRAAATA